MPGAAEKPEFVRRFGRFEIDEQNWQLLRDGEAVLLTPKAFDLLLLVRNSGRMLSKEEIMGSVWANSFVEETSLTSTISRLRKVLHADGERYIETLPKRGYRFKAHVRSAFPPGVESGHQYTAQFQQSTEESVSEEMIEEFSEYQEFESSARHGKILLAVAVALILVALTFALLNFVQPSPPA